MLTPDATIVTGMLVRRSCSSEVGTRFCPWLRVELFESETRCALRDSEYSSNRGRPALEPVSDCSSGRSDAARRLRNDEMKSLF